MWIDITLLFLVEMTKLSIDIKNKDKTFVLNFYSRSNKKINLVYNTLRKKLKYSAEKNIILLRKLYIYREDLINNSDIIEEYIFDAFKILRPTINLSSLYNSSLIIESVIEDINIKSNLLSHLVNNINNDVYILSNTSSIPINKINELWKLKLKIIGLHFFNPPIQNKVNEIIKLNCNQNDIISFTKKLLNNFGNIYIKSNDISWFIWNNYFVREIIIAFNFVEELINEFGYIRAIYIIDYLTQKLLIRPLWIFRLIDYVWIDICDSILKNISKYTGKLKYNSNYFKILIDNWIIWWISYNWYQKNWIFWYENNKIVSVYNLSKNKYINITPYKDELVDIIWPIHKKLKPWRTVKSINNKKLFIEQYFSEINNTNSKWVNIIKKYNSLLNKIPNELIDIGLTDNTDDINKLLYYGFWHLYPLDNNYLK